MGKSGLLQGEELLKTLEKVPNKVRLDVVQLGLDLVGIVDPTGAADVTSAFISLLRGDLLGAALSAASALPLGDLAKAGKFRKYANSLAELVSIALKQPKLAWALRTPLRQIRDLLNGLRGLPGVSQLPPEMIRHLDSLSASLSRYFGKITLVERFGWEAMARKLGSSGGQFVGHGGQTITVNGLVDVLANAGRSSQKAVRDEAEEFMGKLALSERWRITGGIHPSASDATRHITVEVAGIEGQFHLRVDKQGRLFQITHGKKGEPLSNLDRGFRPR